MMTLLFAKSGNNCAFDECSKKLFDQKNRFVGEVCHIKAAMPGGQRFDKRQSNEDRRKPENLILLCRNHHKETDDVDEFCPERLQQIKEKHENLYTNELETLTEEFYQSFVRVFQEQINDKLSEIERLLTRVDLFKPISQLFKLDNRDFRPSLKLFQDNLFYQSTAEAKLTNTFFDHFKTNKANVALLSGFPTNGKTTFAINLSEVLTDKEDFEAYYIEMKPDLPIKEIHNELTILNRFKTFIVLDDIHKNLPLATEIYVNSNKWGNLSFLFLSRVISKEIQEDETGLNLYKEIRLNEQIRNQNIAEKFQGIIKAFAHQHKITKPTGSIKTVLKNCNRNLLKLHLLLRLWLKELDLLTC